MSRKSEKVAAIVCKFQGQGLEPHYLAYFDCFNRQLFYEAHDVLEELWLPERKGPDGAFYKGLIQLAGAFVHLQKGRLRPATALFKLARTSLQAYPAMHQRLDLRLVLGIIEQWLSELESGDLTKNPLLEMTAPALRLTNP